MADSIRVADGDDWSPEPRNLTERDLRELLEDRPGPAVTMFVASAGPAPDPAHDRLRLRAAIERANKLLVESSAGGDGDLLQPVTELLAGSRRWPPGEVLAVFRSPGFLRVYRLSQEIPPLVVVGPTFHTRPLIRHLQSPSRFWVLELAQGGVRLWEGDAGRVRKVEPNPLPPDLQQALGLDFERYDTFVQRGSGGRDRATARRSQQGGSVGAFSGHGVGDDDRDASVDRFFSIVDGALADYLGPEADPVVIGAVSEHHGRYRSISGLDSLAPSGIEASISSWAPQRIHEAAWPIALETADARIAKMLDLWERAYGSGKGETDLAGVARLAVAGRIRTLLIEQDRRFWGTIDRQTGEIEVSQVGGEDPAADAVELLDEISELVVLRGGATLVLPNDRMPTPTGVAGILR